MTLHGVTMTLHVNEVEHRHRHLVVGVTDVTGVTIEHHDRHLVRLRVRVN